MCFWIILGDVKSIPVSTFDIILASHSLFWSQSNFLSLLWFSDSLIFLSLLFHHWLPLLYYSVHPFMTRSVITSMYPSPSGSHYHMLTLLVMLSTHSTHILWSCIPLWPLLPEPPVFKLWILFNLIIVLHCLFSFSFSFSFIPLSNLCPTPVYNDWAEIVGHTASCTSGCNTLVETKSYSITLL